jgi:hypothetical protein
MELVRPQLRNAADPMLVTLLGIVTPVRPVQNHRSRNFKPCVILLCCRRTISHCAVA